jgi:hypothetical protein
MLKVVFGRRGSGKTTFIAHSIDEYKKPVIILDVLGNFGEGGPYHNPKWISTYSVSDALYELLRYRKEKKHVGIIVLQDGDINRAVDFMSSALWKNRDCHGEDGGTLVLDEGDSVRVADAPCFDEAIRYGRNRGIDLVVGCRRPAEISKNITAGADRAYLFTTHEPRDLEYYRDFLEDDDLAYSLGSLPPYHGIYRDFVGKKTMGFRTKSSGEIEYLSEHKKETAGKVESHFVRRPRKANPEPIGEPENDPRANSEPDQAIPQ